MSAITCHEDGDQQDQGEEFYQSDHCADGADPVSRTSPRWLELRDSGDMPSPRLASDQPQVDLSFGQMCAARAADLLAPGAVDALAQDAAFVGGHTGTNIPRHLRRCKYLLQRSRKRRLLTRVL